MAIATKKEARAAITRAFDEARAIYIWQGSRGETISRVIEQRDLLWNTMESVREFLKQDDTPPLAEIAGNKP